MVAQPFEGPAASRLAISKPPCCRTFPVHALLAFPFSKCGRAPLPNAKRPPHTQRGPSILRRFWSSWSYLPAQMARGLSDLYNLATSKHSNASAQRPYACARSPCQCRSLGQSKSCHIVRCVQSGPSHDPDGDDSRGQRCNVQELPLKRVGNPIFPELFRVGRIHRLDPPFIGS